jgi:hypothetical protein
LDFSFWNARSPHPPPTDQHFVAVTSTLRYLWYHLCVTSGYPILSIMASKFQQQLPMVACIRLVSHVAL